MKNDPAHAVEARNSCQSAQRAGARVACGGRCKRPPHRVYESYRLEARDGDVMLLRNGGAIEATGAGPWTHAGKVVWLRNTLMVAEMREWHGGRLVTLRDIVRRYPGRVDIVRPDCGREVATLSAELAARQAGKPYGWAVILALAIRRAPLIRLALRVLGYNPNPLDATPAAWDEPKTCSQMAAFVERRAASDRRIDFDPFPGRADWTITPDDFGFSARHYRVAEGLRVEGKA